MSESTAILDWRTLPIAAPDRVLIEASAGTGKTWTIAALYLRLLLEGDPSVKVEQILVATFTEAAARELRERLRARLADAEHELQRIALDKPRAIATGTERDGVLQWLAEKFADAQAAKPALRRIQLARIDFDRAPIGTIHSLCQRVLRDFPLDSGAAAAAQGFLDEGALRRECVEDFWRRRYFGGALVEAAESRLFRDGPAGLLRDVHGMLAHGDPVVEPNGLDALDAGIERLREPDKLRELDELCEADLYKRSNSAARSRLLAIGAALKVGGDVADVLEAKVDDKFEDAELDAQQHDTARLRLRENALIHELRELAHSAKRRADFARGRVLAAACEFCRAEMPRRAGQLQGLTFSMLIGGVHARVRGGDDHFARVLFEAFPFALVDEFQDTDAHQFEIFDAIYRGTDGKPRGWLAMIGDPKQAIYGFRGGDIAAYLKARESAARRCAMDTNYRSTQALVAALNALYGVSDLGDARIAYQPMRCSGKAEEKALRQDGDPAPPLRLHVIPGIASRRRGGPKIAHGKTESVVLDDCTERIVEMLTGSTATLGDKRIEPRDIVVLVPRNAQITQMRRRLSARGVPCAGSRESVLDGAVAQELELFLTAVMHPDDAAAVRGALATRLLGFDLRAILDLQSNVAGFELELDRFARWHELARTRGLLGTIVDLLTQRASVLLQLPDGAGIVADLRHLGELIAAREAQEPGAEGAIAWFAQLRREGAGEDDRGQRVRVLGEGNAVRIMTLHAAKGLEFPVVFLPLAWRIFDGSGQHQPKVLRFHDEAGRVCIDVGSQDFGANLGRHFNEDLDERQRLLYVALTRAQCAVHVYWVDREESGGAAWQMPAIDILLRHAMESRGLTLTAASMPALVATIADMNMVEPAARGGMEYRAAHATPPERSPRSPLPALRPFEWLHSFTGITRRRIAEDADAAAADESEVAVPDIEAAVAQAEHPELLALDAFRGRRFGDAVHKALEQSGMRPVERSVLLAGLAAEGLDAENPESGESACCACSNARSNPTWAMACA